MLAVAQVAAAVAALAHVWFFVLESLLFTRPTVWRRFGLRSQADADVVRAMAFNQGFYNLFLALGAAAGVVTAALDHETVGATLIGATTACMVGAGAVLLATNRRFVVAAAVQAVPPLIALVAVVTWAAA